MNINKELLIALLNNGHNYICSTSKSHINYEINKIRYEILFIKGTYRETKDYITVTSTIPDLDFYAVDSRGNDEYFILYVNNTMNSIKIDDRREMADLLTKMEEQINWYDHKLKQDALNILTNAQSDHF